MSDLTQPPCFEVSGLTGGWGEMTVVEDFSLTMSLGESVAIIGRNGVGKTTLMELLMGRASQSAGTIRLNDRDISNLSTHRRARIGLGLVPQEREVFASLTVAEHLTIAMRPGRWDADAIFTLFPSLAKRRSSLGAQLSGGEQQMLAMARALVGNPRVLLMDEPSEGLAPVVVEQLVEALKVLASDQSLAVLLVEQRVDLALQLSDRCLVMDRGKVVFSGRSEELSADPSRLSQIMGFSGAI